MILDNDARQFSAYTAYPPSSDLPRRSAADSVSPLNISDYRLQMTNFLVRRARCATGSAARLDYMYSCMHTEIMRKATKPARGHSARRVRSGRSGNQITETGASPRGKIRLTMYLDMAVVEYFRSRAGGRGYQTLINEALKQAIEQESLEDVLRRVIREEARPYQTGKGKS